MRYSILLDRYVDTGSGYEDSYLLALVKMLPQIDMIQIDKCLLHSVTFSEMGRNCKIAIIKDSHVKFTPFSPGNF
jgi:hypothetical protein